MPAWQKKVKKTVFTLNVNGYSPEMTALTYPLLKAYARKIGADFYPIRERKFPEWPVTFEKLQIYELAQQMENDWNIYIDSDCLVHPETPDLTLIIPKDTVAHFGSDFAPTRWKTDRYFRRDGRHISSGNWLALASDLCIDLWKPPDDLTPAEAIANIQPSVAERVSGVIEPSHLIDDYLLSRNIAKYGLKYVNIRKVLSETYQEGGGFFFHHYLYPTDKKIEELIQVLERWKVTGLMQEIYRETDMGGTRNAVDEAAAIHGWMSRPELAWLYEQAQKMDSIVEIGSWKGRSTYALCSGCQGKVYAVDPFPFDAFPGPGPTYDQFVQNVGHFPNLTTLKMTSEEAATSDLIPPMVDMVFIDGNHDYEMVLKDLQLWAPRTRRLICGHDLEPNWPGVEQALTEFYGMEQVGRGPWCIWHKK